MYATDSTARRAPQGRVKERCQLPTLGATSVGKSQKCTEAGCAPGPPGRARTRFWYKDSVTKGAKGAATCAGGSSKERRPKGNSRTRCMVMQAWYSRDATGRCILLSTKRATASIGTQDGSMRPREGLAVGQDICVKCLGQLRELTSGHDFGEQQQPTTGLAHLAEVQQCCMQHRQRDPSLLLPQGPLQTPPVEAHVHVGQVIHKCHQKGDHRVQPVPAESTG
jgi:hypothetical protein